MRVAIVASFAGLTGLAGLAGLGGCANDPVYIPGPAVMEAGVDMMGMRSEARASVALPIKLETASDLAEREAAAARLDPVQVPYVKIGDIEIEVEWTIRNLDTSPGKALVELNGANEFYSYDPSIILLDAEEEETAPGLTGNIPIDVPVDGEISGLFTEDDVREAAIDLDQITRGNIHPFAATFTISKNAREFQPMTLLMPGAEDYEQVPMGPAVPREAFAQFTRIDLVFRPNRHMTLEYNIRIRDLRGIMHELLLTAETEKPDELATFTPMVFNVAAPPAP